MQQPQQPQQQFQLFQHHQHHLHIQQVHSDTQLERRNSPDLDTERNRNDRERQPNRIGSSLDFRNLCRQRIDVENLRAKLPSLPQLKLPKALPKLRGRRIFRSSKGGSTRATAGSTKDRGYTGPTGGRPASQQLQVAPQSQEFINRTPQRISTISSLMYEQGQPEPGNRSAQLGTYRSSDSLNDDYYAPGSGERASRPISPIKIPSVEPEKEAAAPTFTQRIQRGYKSLSELRLKHLFARQVTVRKDNIEVDRYVEQYERELKSEKLARERRDREIAENYDIKIKTLSTTRQNTFEDEEEIDREHLERSRGGHHAETDESGMEATPPLPTRRRPGIAATRFAKVRQPPLEMETELQVEEVAPRAPADPAPAPPRSSSYKQLLSKLPSFPNLPQISRNREEKVKSSDETNQEASATSKSGLRQNIKRIRKSIKRPAKIKVKPKSGQESDDEEEQDKDNNGNDKAKGEPVKSSSNLRARLGRFASTEQIQQRFRRSFKRTSTKADNGEETGAAKAGVLGGFLLGSHLDKALAKLNEKMHQLKFFQRQISTGQAAGEAKPKPNTVGHEPVEIDDDNELAATYHHSDSDDSGEDVSAEEAFGQLQREHSGEGQDSEQDSEQERVSTVQGPKAAVTARQMAKLAEIQAASKGAVSAAWSSESLEEIADEDYPRVLIHQEHSDAFESTLIIAVATKTSVSVSPAGRARDSSEKLPEKAPPADPWVPNDKIIASFKQEPETWPAPALYKPKSIDIFEASGEGGASAFDDFDEALRHAPVLRISERSNSYGSIEESTGRVVIRMQSPQIGNSRESLMAQDEEEEDDEEETEGDGPAEVEDHDDSLSERPPSASPPPPPLPQRRPPRVSEVPVIYDAVPPPLPVNRPPQTVQPRVDIVPKTVALPQRSASMSKPSKPLVKTSSLRLTYNEQVSLGDTGKVNKLISRFEGGRPRLLPRRMHSEELDRTRDDHEEEEPQQELVVIQMEQVLQRKVKSDSITPTNRSVIIPQITLNNNGDRQVEKPREKQTEQAVAMKEKREKLDLSLDRQNSNCSRSEYGSPLSFPSSRRSSTPTNLINNNPTNAPPIVVTTATQAPHHPGTGSNPMQNQRRSRRSMTRDDDNFYSFDSDEENSYYSISPSGSSRYVVEI